MLGELCVVDGVCFFFKQKTAYEMRISDWSSDVRSSDLPDHASTRQIPTKEAPPVMAGPGEPSLSKRGRGVVRKDLVAERADGLGAHHGADRVAEPRRRERVAEAFIAPDYAHGVDLLVQRAVAGGCAQPLFRSERGPW